jgi:hypothetical protein
MLVKKAMVLGHQVWRRNDGVDLKTKEGKNETHRKPRPNGISHIRTQHQNRIINLFVWLKKR